MNLSEFLTAIEASPAQIAFSDTIKVIEDNYTFTETAFKNGDIENAAGENNGSCKIFAFAKLQNLGVEQTLQCFGDYYRVDVLQSPNSDDHQNIRNFIKHGWNGVNFSSEALTSK